MESLRVEPDHPAHKDLRAGNVACAVLNQHREEPVHPWDLYPAIKRPAPRMSRDAIARNLRSWMVMGMGPQKRAQ